MIAIGRDILEAKDEFTGLGGRNYTPVHIDIIDIRCRNKKLYLDGQLIGDNNRIVVPELA